MQDRENTVVTNPRRVPWDKGKLIGAKPPLRPKHVWSIRTKLQVEGRTRDLAILRCCRPQGRRCRSKWICSRSGHCPTEKVGTARQVRVDRTDPSSGRRLRESGRQEARRIYVHRPPWLGKEHHDETIRAARLRVDCMHRPRPTSFRHPLTTTDQGNPDLPTYRQSARRAAPAPSHQDRKHCQVPRYRGR